MSYSSIVSYFNQQFGHLPPVVVQSPGRVNFIGEHTDYNEGFVLPAAINKYIYVAVSKRADEKIVLHSVAYNEGHEVEWADIAPVKGWATYILGVANQIKVRGYLVGGFNLVIDGNVPIGSGLSSSAAMECATAFALNNLFLLGISKLEMVQIAQKAEQTYAGVMCGIMDMFASMFGKKDHVIKLDCRSLQYEYEPMMLEGYEIVLFNSNVEHSLASTEYNTRRKQCEQGVEWIKPYRPEIKTLRDVTMQMLELYVEPKDKTIFRRCKYFVQEIDRLTRGCVDLEHKDLAAFGRKMFATHRGLSNDYEVSCKELDFLVEAVQNNTDVIGARMMGGGFGGCTINLVKEAGVPALIDRTERLYAEKMHKNVTSYVVNIGDGTSEVNAD